MCKLIWRLPISGTPLLLRGVPRYWKRSERNFDQGIVGRAVQQSRPGAYARIHTAFRRAGCPDGPYRFPRFGLSPYVLGPRSTCCQSVGRPLSSSALPPPQRSPFRITICPHTVFSNVDAKCPNEMSTPVAGQLRCVLRLGGAVGRPWRLSCRWSWGDRHPEIIQTGRPNS